MDLTVYGDVHIHTAETKKEVSVQTLRGANSVTVAKKNVRLRDRRCKCCGDEHSELEIHHIYPVAERQDMIADESNMIVLCKTCHTRYHNRYDLDECNPVTFTDFIKMYGKR